MIIFFDRNASRLLRSTAVIFAIWCTFQVTVADGQTLPLRLVDTDIECQSARPFFTPDADTVVILDCDNRVRLWPIGSAKVDVATDSAWEVHETMVFSPDGRNAYSAGVTGWLWDVERWEEVAYDPSARSSKILRYLSDGSLVIGTNGIIVYVIDATSGQSVRTIGPRRPGFSSMIVTADNASVIVGFSDIGLLNRIRIADGTMTTIGGFNGETFQMEISPDGNRLLVSRNLRDGIVNQHQVVEYDAASGAFLRLIDTVEGGDNGDVYDIDYSPDGQYIIMTMSGEAPRVYESLTLAGIGSIGTRQANRVEFSRDGRRILVAGGDFIDVWEFETPGNVTNAVTGAITAKITSVAPNPVHETATVEFMVSSEDPVVFQLIDGVGRVVWESENRSYRIGRNVLSLGVESIPSGQYRLALSSGRQVTSIPIVVSR